MTSCSSSPAPMRSRRSCRGRTPTSSSSWRTSSASPAPGTSCPSPGCRPTGSPSRRCPPWPSARRTAVRGSSVPSRSGTSCPTASSSTSTNTACTRPAPPPPRRHERRSAVPATERSLELAKTAAVAADDKLATTIAGIDVSEQLALTDVFVIVSAGTDRQVGAIVDEVEDKLREKGAKPIRREGERDGRWVLLDFGDIVVHVQHDEERDFYELERLWKDCPEIDLGVPKRRDA